MMCDKCDALIVGPPYVVSEDTETVWHKNCYSEIQLAESVS